MNPVTQNANANANANNVEWAMELTCMCNVNNVQRTDVRTRNNNNINKCARSSNDMAVTRAQLGVIKGAK